MKARLILILMLAVIVTAIPAHATKYVKWDAPGPAHDGASWCTAFLTIQAALNVAGAGETVKVAQGTYQERIVFKSAAILQGGFRANTPPCPPSAPDNTRDPATYVTIIDGGANTASSRTVTSFAGGTINGFTIRGAETALYINTTFTASGNIVESGASYGIYCTGSSPTISGNTMVGGTTGTAGVYLDGGSAQVYGNSMSGWSQVIYAYKSTAQITGNVITGGGTGFYCLDGSPTFSGNTLSAAKTGAVGIRCSADTWYAPFDWHSNSCTATVSGNSVTGYTSAAIKCDATRSCGTFNCATGNCSPTVVGNRIAGSLLHGVEINRATPTLSGNLITDSGNCGVYCYDAVEGGVSMVALTIDGNIIAGQKKGVYCKGVTVTVKNNTIRNSKAEGILCDGGSATGIGDNTIIGANIGVGCYGTTTVATSPKVHRNIVIGARTTGIVCQYSASEVWSNLIRDGAKTGIATQGGTAKLWNNTIVKNPWYGIHLEFGTPDVANNIISGSAIGVFADGGIPSFCCNNDLWANTSDYEGMTKPACDIAVDPIFLAPAVGEYHLKPASPCIGVGDNAKAGSTKDLDYKDRILPAGGVVDIGCFEWDNTPYWIREPGQAKVIDPQYQVRMKPEVVTAAWTDSFYIQDDGRSSGILVAKAAHGLTGGQRASVTGTTATNADGEVFLQATDAEAAGSGKADPLGLPYRCLGGGPFMDSGRGQQGITSVAGMNNIGLLVKVWGRIVEIEPVTEPSLPTWFKIDEGADNSPRLIKCVVAEGDPVIDPSWLNKFAFLTGISSCQFDGPALISVIKLRKGETPIVY